jgi:hypothetical protein
MNNKAKFVWGVAQGSLVIFALLMAIFTLNSMGALRSTIGYYSWLPNTQAAFNEFIKQLGVGAAIGSMLDIILLVVRWVRYGFQRPFFT